MGFAAATLILMATGCASIINETSAPVRVETITPSSAEVKDMECRTENDYGVVTVETPGTANVHRSSKDLQIVCTKPGESEARGVAISRANAGLAGNIIFGSGIGAIVDHNRGTACTYPQWIRLVVSRLTTFDRGADKDNIPNQGTSVAIGPQAVHRQARLHRQRQPRPHLKKASRHGHLQKRCRRAHSSERAATTSVRNGTTQ